MKILIDKTTKTVKYSFEDSEEVYLNDRNIEAPGMVISDMNRFTSELIEGVIPPAEFEINKWRYIDGSFAIIDELVDLKAQKLVEFDPILNEFSLLVYRAKIISGESPELDQVVDIIRQQKDKTVSDINAFTDVETLMEFSFKAEDVEAMKNLLKPFLL